MPKLRAWPFLICHASCVAVILLTACATPASPVEVAPPLVITVVVTPIGNANGAPATSEAPTTVTASPSSAPSASSYPAPLTANITAVYQPFERGFMIYLSDRQAVWVFVQSFVSNTGGTTTTPNFGAWLAFADTFKEGDPETDPSIIAPAGFLQPKRGFGKVWREHPEVRDAVGWGLDYERPYTTLAADYSIGVFDSTGSYLPRSFIHTVATIDGTLVHVDEAARVWSKP